MIAELHVAPDPSGDDAAPYRNIDAAIAVLRTSGLRAEVGALGTTIEGPEDAVWDALRRAHEACLNGAGRVITTIRIAQWSQEGPTIDSLTQHYADGAEPRS